MQSYYKDGDYNAVCWECGSTRKFSELKKHWKGYYVCPEHWEPRHPQDFVRGIPDRQAVPHSQPQEDTLLYQCTILGIQAVPGYAVAGCAIAKFKNQTMIDTYLSSVSNIKEDIHSAIAGLAVAGKSVAGSLIG